MRGVFLGHVKGRQGLDHSRPGGHSEFRFSFKCIGKPLEAFKVREWEDLVYDSKRCSICYGGVGVSQPGRGWKQGS